jgi:hypothetical protein
LVETREEKVAALSFPSPLYRFKQGMIALFGICQVKDYALTKMEGAGFDRWSSAKFLESFS